MFSLSLRDAIYYNLSLFKRAWPFQLIRCKIILARSQTERDLQIIKSQLLSTKLSNIRSLEQCCLKLEQKIASRKFAIWSLKAQMDSLDSNYDHILQQIRYNRTSIYIFNLIYPCCRVRYVPETLANCALHDERITANTNVLVCEDTPKKVVPKALFPSISDHFI